jgi:Tol biopolymer transport system component
MPSDTHDDIRNLFVQATSDLPASAPALDRTVRRARWRFVRTVSLLALSAVLVVGAVVHAVDPFIRSVPAKTPRMASGSWIVDTETGAATRMVGLPRQAFWFSASRDGSALAVAGEIRGRSQIFLLDQNGTNPRQVTHDRYGASQPALSPDGTTLAYQGFGRSTSRNVFVMDLTTGVADQVTHEPKDVSELEWSPDGTRILYSVTIKAIGIGPTLSRPPSNLLKVVDLRTRHVETTAGDRRSPADFGTWSPGGQIAYMTNGRSPNGVYAFQHAQIWVADADGGNRRMILPLAGAGFSLEWSPTGSSIAFSAPDGGALSTYVVDVDTHLVRHVGPGYVTAWLDDRRIIVSV